MSTTQAVDLRAGGERSLLEWLLGLAAEVRAGEGLTALALAFNGFLILGAY